MYQFGFETLVIVLVPGLLLTAAFVLVIDDRAPGDLEALMSTLHVGAFAKGVGLLVVAATIGSALAAMLWVAEAKGMDRFTAWRMKICSEQFNREWSRYVDNLTKEHNSHISRMVQAFYFEVRAGSASLALAAAVAWATTFSTWIAVTLGVFGLVMLTDSFRLHNELALFRHRHFSAPSVHLGTRRTCGRKGCPSLPTGGGIIVSQGNAPTAPPIVNRPQR
jgi:hypothetical protein